MNHPTVRFAFLFLFLLPISLLTAQESGWAVEKRITYKDGSTTVIKKRLDSGQDVSDALEELEAERPNDAEEVMVRVSGYDPSEEQEQRIEIIRRGENEVNIDIRGDWGMDEDEDWDWNWDWDEQDNSNRGWHRRRHGSSPKTKTFLGVYIDGRADAGVRISGAVRGTGAEEAGLQDGDIITAIAGESLQGRGSLSEVLARHEPGERVAITYLRNGQEQQAAGVLLTRRGYKTSDKYEADPCKVFIGVYLSNNHGEGVRVNGVIRNTPAFESDVQPGDVILALDGVPVNTYNELQVERDKHELGDYFTLTVLRDDREMDIQAQFPTCEEEQEAEEEVTEIEEEVDEEGPLYIPPMSNELQLVNYKAFPNPTVNYVNLQFEGEALPTTVQLIDANGRVLYEDVQNRFDGFYNERLDLSGRAPGTYYLRVQQENRVLTQPVIVVPRV